MECARGPLTLTNSRDGNESEASVDAGSLGTLLIGVAAFLTSVTGMVGQIRNWRGGGKTKSGGQPATPEVVTEAAAVVIEHQREGRHEQQG